MKKMTERSERTRDLLIKHYQTYPKLQTEDIFKYLYQSAFGCEHLVSDEETALAYIRREYEFVPKTDVPLVEPLDGKYCRVHLSCLNGDMEPETLAKLFCLSAKKESSGKADLERKLCVARALIAGGEIPLDCVFFDMMTEIWRKNGYPAVRHSETFRSVYRPAYRVIATAYAGTLVKN
jgi:hypothetical protein